VDFDQVQKSGLMPGTPVAVLHKSRSGQWAFVKDETASGWVETKKLAFTNRDVIADYLRRKNSIYVVTPKADLYADGLMTRYITSVRMGTRLVLTEAAGRGVEVLFPKRQSNGEMSFSSAFIAREDVSFGVLPFTSRMMYRQAFRMLNAPYGWGDMYGEQDCSRFIQMVFATMGLPLPRNSSDQAKIGTLVFGFHEDATEDGKKEALVSGGIGGLTLLRLKGHIMLYLGHVNREPYAIHATWAYRDVGPDGDRPRVINRVAVTGLRLGEGTKKGTLLDRVVSARTLP
jgi:hypothetical protein